MPKAKIRSTILGKLTRRAARLRGSGSALPGLVVEKTDRKFIHDCLSQLPRGIVVVSGTNGKTTTTKIITELLESQGLRVFTNRTGSNFVRGVIAALLNEVTLSGKLHADIAVLELDEAHATHFINTIPPNYSLLLNALSDQTDRFTSIDHTAELLARIAHKTSTALVTNLNDPRLSQLKSPAPITYFGLDPSLTSHFPTDIPTPKTPNLPLVTLADFTPKHTTFLINDEPHTIPLTLRGIHNSLNAAAALALVKTILPDSDNHQLITTLSTIQPAFGRGEVFTINGTTIELLLVKNPSGFQLALDSSNPTNHDHMIAINDNYADGRDTTWLHEVDFSSLEPSGVTIVSGTRTADITSILNDKKIALAHTDENLTSATNTFLTNSSQPKRIFCSYTAMLAIRRHLAKLSKSSHTL